MRDFPTILREQVERVRHVRCVSLAAKLRISIEITENGVGNREARGVGIPRVVESEIAVLVDGLPGSRRGALYEIVLPRVLEVSAPLEGVAAHHLSSGVSPPVNIAGPGTGIWARIERRQSLYADTGHFIGSDLGARKEQRIIQPIPAAQAARAIAAELDIALAIGVRREVEFVHQRRRERAGQADRSHAVRPRPDLFHAPERVLEGGVEVPGSVGAAHREMLVLRDQVIHLEVILAQVGVRRLSPDPVGGPLQESRNRRRQDVEQRLAVMADAIRRDDVAGERRPVQRVGYGADLLKVGIGGIEKFAEVPVAHRQARYRAGVGGIVAPLDPFLCYEEEQLIAFGIVVLGNEDRTAYIEAVLIESVRRRAARDLRERAVIPRPRVGVQGRVAEVLDQVAVKAPPAALRHEADLARRGAAVLGGVVRGEHLHFLHRVHIHRAQHRARRARARRHRAIDHHDVFIGPAAVDIKTAVAHAVGIEGADPLAADHARRQCGQIDGIAAVQCEVLDLLGIDRSTDIGGVGLHLDGRCLHLHLVGDSPDRQSDTHADLRFRVQDDPRVQELLEPRRVGDDGVASDKQLREHIVAVGVGSGAALFAGAFIPGDHNRTGNDGSRFVPDEAGDLPRIELRKNGRNQGNREEDHKQGSHPHPPGIPVGWSNSIPKSAYVQGQMSR